MPEVLAIRYEWRDNAVLIMHNLNPEPREVCLKMNPETESERDLINLLSENHSRADAKGMHRILLEPYGYRWYRVGGLDYLLKRSEV